MQNFYDPFVIMAIFLATYYIHYLLCVGQQPFFPIAVVEKVIYIYAPCCLYFRKTEIPQPDDKLKKKSFKEFDAFILKYYLQMSVSLA